MQGKARGIHQWAGRHSFTQAFSQCAQARPQRPFGQRVATQAGDGGHDVGMATQGLGRHARGPANLLLNTGHGALGFTLAFGTAAAVADAV